MTNKYNQKITIELHSDNVIKIREIQNAFFQRVIKLKPDESIPECDRVTIIITKEDILTKEVRDAMNDTTQRGMQQREIAKDDGDNKLITLADLFSK